jgi:hypothetical protein
MQRYNARCTKETTGACAVCEALAERDRFFRFWLQGGVCVNGVHVMQLPLG